jgi:hypothetical protein
LAAAAIAFLVFKRRTQKSVEELAEEDDSVDAPTLASSTELGEDNVFVSEYGLSDHGNEDAQNEANSD